MASERDVARLVDEAARALGVPWTEAERTEAMAEAEALARLVALVWAYPLPDPVGGWRPVEP
jgi:hypothetical protein